MVNAYNGLRDTRKQHPDVPDLRTAAFLTAIHKVARCYMDLGHLPVGEARCLREGPGG